MALYEDTLSNSEKLVRFGEAKFKFLLAKTVSANVVQWQLGKHLQNKAIYDTLLTLSSWVFQNDPKSRQIVGLLL